MAPRAQDSTGLIRVPRLNAYRSQGDGGSRALDMLDGQPVFTWRWIESMRRDPQIAFGLRILRAPLAQAKWQVKSNSSRVAQFVDSQLKRIWRRSLGKIARMFEPGFAAGEPCYALENRLAVFDRLIDVHFRDAEPLEFTRGPRRGEWAGLRIARVRDDLNHGAGVDLRPPHAFWCANEPEYGSLYGQSRLRGCFAPWREKRGKHGAIDSRRLYYHKCAFTGGSIRYPPGMTDMGDPDSGPLLMSNQDIAREIMEKFENGGILILPNVKDLTTGEYLWTFETAKYGGDAQGLIDYPKELDREILIGLGIPPELVEAATVGSGYSGRAIPAQVFFASLDEVINTIIEAVDRQIIRWLVLVNFGRGARYEIEPASLAEMVAREPDKIRESMRDNLDDGSQDNPLDAAMAAAKQRTPDDAQRVSLSALRQRVIGLAAKKYPDLAGWERDANSGAWRLSRDASGHEHEPAGSKEGGQFAKQSGTGTKLKEKSKKRKGKAATKATADSDARSTNWIRQHPEQADNYYRHLNKEDAATAAYKDLGTKAPAFKGWFGDWENDPDQASKVTNADGEPQENARLPTVVFHGTNQKFDEFSHDDYGKTDHGVLGKGYYFSELEQVARQYSVRHGGDHSEVKAVYLNIRKPFVVDEKHSPLPGFPDGLRSQADAEQFTNWLVEQGYDGVYCKEVQEWVALESTQVKAVDNAGTFDPANPHIRLSKDVTGHEHKGKGPGGGQFATTSTSDTAGAKAKGKAGKATAVAAKSASAATAKAAPPVPEQQLSEKAQRAKAAHVMVDKDIQRYAEEHNEPKFAKAMGGVSFPDGEPVDVAVPGKDGALAHGIELKTMVVNSNNKITMKRSAMERKAEWEKKNGVPIHTVVLDDSAVKDAGGPGIHDESKRRIFYRRGYGSFRVGTMLEVKDAKELKKLMVADESVLPPAAQRPKGQTLGKLAE